MAHHNELQRMPSRGRVGIAGTVGEPGPQGPIGPQGPQGIQGIPGIGAGSEAFPVGSVYISVLSTNPATLLGYGVWSALGVGRVLVGVDVADPAIDAAEKTTGAKTVAAAGTVAAPVFTGTLASLPHVGAAVADHNYTPAGAVAAPVFTGAALPTHSHELPFIKVAGATGALRMLAPATFGTGTSRAPESTSAAPTANTTAAAVLKDQALSAGTPAGTNSAPAFTGTAAPLPHVVTQPTAHAYTPAGGNSAPAFTGSATSVVQPSIAVYMWKRTA